MTIIIGIIITIIGSLLIIKTEWFLNNFGRIRWFEEKLGSEGGSRFGYKMIGLLFIIIGIIAMTGSNNEFLGWLLSPLLKYSQPK